MSASLFKASKNNVPTEPSDSTPPSFVDSTEFEASNVTNEECIEEVEEAYVTFLVRIRLVNGRNLAAKDASGSSDPYVKFKYKNRTCYKSATIFKNLNPVWNEEFSVIIDDPITPIIMEVFDYDRWASDDFIGETSRIVTIFEDENSKSGEIEINATMLPMTAIEKNEFLKKSSRGVMFDRPKRDPVKISQTRSSVVNIVLIEGHNLCMPDQSKAHPDPFVKFKLGTEKYKSKVVTRSQNPKWLEQFDMHIYDSTKQTIELTVIDRKTNACIGKCSIELDRLQKETATKLSCDLDRGTAILLLISVTGITSANEVVESAEFTSDDVRNAIVRKYSLLKTARCLGDIGFLTVKVFRAQNLLASDFVSKSNPFVTVELVNALLQTHTEYKTANPEWNKLFTFAVKDIHSVLEITVYNEDTNKKSEFLGKIAIPLLCIENCKERWYALKDRKLSAPSGGQILLEMDVIWNPVRAALRTFSPREKKYVQNEPKFKRRIFLSNYSRLKEFALSMMQVRDYVQSCFDWDYPLRTIIAFVLFVVVVYFFHLHYIPIILLLLFLRPYKIGEDGVSLSLNKYSKLMKTRSDSEEDEETTEQNPGTSIRERLSTVQDILAKIQSTMDYTASLLERIRNTFNFTQPLLSLLAIVVLCVATILLYFVPLRWIVLAWGINKFTKKLRNPNFVPNNELLDFLSCVPSESEINAYKELPVSAIDRQKK